MRVEQEKVLATLGSWVIKGRVVEFNTAQTGKVRRAELFLEEIKVPGQPTNELGFSIKDIEGMHKLLVAYVNQTGEAT